MDTLLVPLRSNAAWFTTADSVLGLEARIKSALLIHDQLLFQDGHYLVTVWQDGKMEFEVPPHQISEEQRHLTYHQQGGEVRFGMVDNNSGELLPILQGPAAQCFEVDFLPILKASGLVGQDYIALQVLVPADAAKAEIAAKATADKRNEHILDQLDGDIYQKHQVVEAAHYDTWMAVALDHPFIADQRIAPFISAKNGQVASKVWTAALT
jgi:hypothetical protein